MEVAKIKNLTIQVSQSPTKMSHKGELWNKNILDLISKRTKVVALSQVHWSEGIVFDLAEIRKKCDAVEAYLVIDGTQSVGAFPFSVADVQPDVLICAGYKWLMGPYGFGLAYYGSRFDQGMPIENNWINRLHSEDFSGLVNYQTEYKALANRYSVGEHSNFVAIGMLLNSIARIIKWTPESIQEYCRQITSPLSRLIEHGYQIAPHNQRADHLIGIKLPDQLSTDKLKASLRANKIYASVRGRYLRVAPYVFNEEEDLEKLVDVLI